MIFEVLGNDFKTNKFPWTTPSFVKMYKLHCAIFEMLSGRFIYQMVMNVESHKANQQNDVSSNLRVIQKNMVTLASRMFFFLRVPCRKQTWNILSRTGLLLVKRDKSDASHLFFNETMKPPIWTASISTWTTCNCTPHIHSPPCLFDVVICPK